MPFEIESKTKEASSQPTVGQMLELQKLGIVLAKDQQKLRDSRGKSNAHIFLAQEVERPEMVEADENFRYSTHRFTGRVARVGFRHWSMRVVEAFWVRDTDLGQDDGFRAAYAFSWTDKQVLGAVKNVRAKRAEEAESYVVEKPAEAVQAIGHWTGFWQAINLFETVSQADCGRLIQDMQLFGEDSRRDVRLAQSVMPGVETKL